MARGPMMESPTRKWRLVERPKRESKLGGNATSEQTTRGVDSESDSADELIVEQELQWSAGGGGVEWKNPSENQIFEVRGFVAVSMGCWREATLNGKTQTKIDILACEASMNCRRGAALNGKTQARIKVLRCEALLRFRWAAGGKRR